MPVFTDFSPVNTTYTVPASAAPDAPLITVTAREASLSWPPPHLDHLSSKFAVFPSLATRDEVAAIRGAIQARGPSLAFNMEPNTVDAMPQQEIYLHQGERFSGNEKDDDQDDRLGSDPTFSTRTAKAERRAFRGELRELMKPIEDRITAVIQARFPKVCGPHSRPGRKCTPCYSKIRRYLPGGRQSHAMHRDGQSLVTVVTSLSDYETEYYGGLYVAAGGANAADAFHSGTNAGDGATGAGARRAIALNRGDSVIHQSDLLHGVQVQDDPETGLRGARWSWILWFKDSNTCEAHGHEWSEDCALAGNPICEYMMGWRLFTNPTMSAHQINADSAMWKLKSAQHGLPEAMFYAGRSALGSASIPPSPTLGDFSGVVRWLSKAINEAGYADAAYQLGHLMLLGKVDEGEYDHLLLDGNGSDGENAGACAAADVDGSSKPGVPGAKALALFELAAAGDSSTFGGTSFAQYNLGVATLYGFAGRRRDPVEAAAWFEASGLPEGMMAYSLYLKGLGRTAEATLAQDRARQMGFGDLERPNKRDKALFSLHNNWAETKGTAGLPPRW